MHCIMCAKDGARYRCRLCSSAYCSTSCFKAHRSEARTEEDGNKRYCSIIMEMQKHSLTRASNSHDIFSDEALRKGEHVDREDADIGRGEMEEGMTAISQKDPTLTPPPLCGESSKQLSERKEDNEEESGELYILKERHLSALANNTNIRRALRSKELQQMLLTIDKSRSRLDALDAALYNNTDFKHFCDEVNDILTQAEKGKSWHKRRRQW
ncbi:unnamed protein product [Phytomonas sp. Hart1]|nr:unnamed protein product [Phytomonas sp. Hart1]|eukprot:CCW71474.1 unnamed protein product [Phytomonas sp. isolate Hart1]